MINLFKKNNLNTLKLIKIITNNNKEIKNKILKLNILNINKYKQRNLNR